MNPTTKVAFYIRSNFHGQDRMASDIQLLTEECLKQGKKLVHIYVDHGYSGNELTRPSLQRLLDDAKNGLFEEVMTPELKHISRRMVNTLHIIEELHERKVSVSIPNMRFKLNDPTGNLTLNLLVGIQAFEAAQEDFNKSSEEM